MQINNSHNEFISSLKLIPKIGDKSAQQLVKNFKSIKNFFVLNELKIIKKLQYKIYLTRYKSNFKRNNR
jgi:excinuclease UvrABC nuclease subunit